MIRGISPRSIFSDITFTTKGPEQQNRNPKKSTTKGTKDTKEND